MFSNDEHFAWECLAASLDLSFIMEDLPGVCWRRAFLYNAGQVPEDCVAYLTADKQERATQFADVIPTVVVSRFFGHIQPEEDLDPYSTSSLSVLWWMDDHVVFHEHIRAEVKNIQIVARQFAKVKEILTRGGGCGVRSFKVLLQRQQEVGHVVFDAPQHIASPISSGSTELT